MRSRPSILHIDLDAFFASVEQRDKPSLRGRPVIVGGIGPRGVVSTASYEARKYGARSAMSTAEARAICPPGTAFLWPRFEAYQASSRVVMEILRDVSPAVEQVSIDEAYVDLEASDLTDFSPPALTCFLTDLQARVEDATDGLMASAGVASSKMMAKLASEMNKPAGVCVIPAGDEVSVLEPMSVRAVNGVGPATAARLRSFGVETVGDLARLSLVDLVSVFGDKHGHSLYALARADDNRDLTLTREAKSISAEETFDTDVRERRILRREIELIAERVAERMSEKGMFARTVHLKARLPDFTAVTRSATLAGATGDAATIAHSARRLLDSIDTGDGVRLIGVGVSSLVPHSQGELFDIGAPTAAEPDAEGELELESQGFSSRFTPPSGVQWRTGADVVHDEYGAGWVWGSGRHRVTVRFEGPNTQPGTVKTFDVNDARLHLSSPAWVPHNSSPKAVATER